MNSATSFHWLPAIRHLASFPFFPFLSLSCLRADNNNNNNNHNNNINQPFLPFHPHSFPSLFHPLNSDHHEILSILGPSGRASC